MFEAYRLKRRLMHTTVLLLAGSTLIASMFIFSASPVHAASQTKFGIQSESKKKASSSPHATNFHTSVVLVHGFEGGDSSSGSSTNGSGSGVDCAGYWNDAKSFIGTYWGGDVRTVQFYNGDKNCNQNGNEHTYSADLHNGTYTSHCTSYNGGNDGTNNESLFHVSCLFAWYLYDNFGQHGWEVVLVAHSMGGLIVRETIYQVQNRASLGTGNIFPPTLGHVTDAIIANTPNDGIAPIGSIFGCGGCRQMSDMRVDSVFIKELQNKGEDPQAGGTDWTLIGSVCDGLVSWGNATHMIGGNHFVIYENYVNPNTCYDHGGVIHDKGLDLNASQDYCDAGSTTATQNSCFFNGGLGRLTSTTTGAHGLQDILYAIGSNLS